MADATTLSVLLRVKDQASAALERVEGRMNRLGSTIGKHRVGIGKAMLGIGAAVTGIGIVMAKTAATFDGKMREVNSLIGLTDAEFQQLKDDTLELAAAIGVDAVQASEALYQAISAGVPRGNVFTFMEVASKAAIAGVTDTEVAVDGLTTVINAFKLQYSDAQKVADTMFVAVQRGKTTFEELSSAMFYAAPIASAMGVDFEAIAAAAATMTKQGIPTKAAFTSLRQAFVALQKPTVDMEEALRQVGFASGRALLDAHGLQKGLLTLTTQTSLTESEMVKAFGSVEAFQAVISLTGKNAQMAAEDLAASYDSMGAATAAFDVINQGVDRQWQIMTARLKVVAIELGDVLLPIVGWLTKRVSALAQVLRGLQQEHPALVKWVGLLAFGLGGLAAAFGSILLILPTFTAGIGILTASFGGLSLAMWPVTAVVLAVTAAVAAAIIIWKQWDEWSTKIKVAVVLILGPLALLVVAVKTLYDNWEEVWWGIKSTTELVVNGVVSRVNVLLGRLASFVEGVGRVMAALPGMPQGVVDAMDSAVDALRRGVVQIDITDRSVEAMVHPMHQMKEAAEESFGGVGQAAQQAAEQVGLTSAEFLRDQEAFFAQRERADIDATIEGIKGREAIYQTDRENRERQQQKALAARLKAEDYFRQLNTDREYEAAQEVRRLAAEDGQRRLDDLGRRIQERDRLRDAEHEREQSRLQTIEERFEANTERMLFSASEQGQAWAALGGRHDKVLEAMAQTAGTSIQYQIDEWQGLIREGEGWDELLLRLDDSGKIHLQSIAAEMAKLAETAGSAGDEMERALAIEARPKSKAGERIASRQAGLISQREAILMEMMRREQAGVSLGNLGEAQAAVDRAFQTFDADPGTQMTGSGGFQYVSHLQHGGIVRSPTLAMVGEAGPEAVIPLGKGGAGGLTVNLVVNGDIQGMDDFESKVSTIIRDAVLAGGFQGVLARA